jgi:glucokinase
VRAIGIDVGGTNLRVAVVAADGTVHEQSRAATPDGDVATLARTIGELVAELPGDLPVGMGLAGAVDGDGVLVFGPNLGMEGEQVRAPVEEAIGRPFVVANDASVAALAEHHVGAATGLDDVVLVTVGTGIGGGVVVDGRLLVGAHGIGGELGHIIIAHGGAPCSCGNRGCFEAYAAGRHFSPDHRQAGEVADAAMAGDAAAQAHIDGAARWLGVGIHGLVATFDPAMVVIGGGAGQAVFDAAIGTVRDTVAELLVGRGHRQPPPIVRAALGDDAGVVGAALLALDRVAEEDQT